MQHSLIDAAFLGILAKKSIYHLNMSIRTEYTLKKAYSYSKLRTTVVSMIIPGPHIPDNVVIVVFFSGVEFVGVIDSVFVWAAVIVVAEVVVVGVVDGAVVVVVVEVVMKLVLAVVVVVVVEVVLIFTPMQQQSMQDTRILKQSEKSNIIAIQCYSLS